ncbi:hypothetical protein [Arthrobacter antioxidans]|uniref:hypothetical protein n=1 Tax=Arthrobacter antioxidans TaxID=2895818 RepID=UPI001FFF6E39|nr:hypothetical protein [Arthrobacter antioxidans]
MATAAFTAWTAVLDALEAALDAAPDSAVDDAGDFAAGDLVRQTAVLAGWIPPQVDGPIPAELLPRAHSISERQQAVLGRLTADADTLRRHRSALGSVRAATARQESAVYLDVTG